MTAVECDVHDLNGGALMCRCVYEALLATKKVDVVARFDLYRDAYLFCSACALQLGDVLTAEEGTVENDAANVWYAERLQVECMSCVEERLAAVGLPSYRELLNTERARLSAK